MEGSLQTFANQGHVDRQRLCATHVSIYIRTGLPPMPLPAGGCRAQEGALTSTCICTSHATAYWGLFRREWWFKSTTSSVLCALLCQEGLYCDSWSCPMTNIFMPVCLLRKCPAKSQRKTHLWETSGLSNITQPSNSKLIYLALLSYPWERTVTSPASSLRIGRSVSVLSLDKNKV